MQIFWYKYSASSFFLFCSIVAAQPSFSVSIIVIANCICICIVICICICITLNSPYHKRFEVAHRQRIITMHRHLVLSCSIGTCSPAKSLGAHISLDHTEWTAPDPPPLGPPNLNLVNLFTAYVISGSCVNETAAVWIWMSKITASQIHYFLWQFFTKASLEHWWWHFPFV